MNRIPVSLILIALLTSAVLSSPQSNPDAIPFEVFASFKRIEKSNPVFAGKPPEWAAAAHAIVVEGTVHYLWALREKKDRRWQMMHSSAPVSDPSAVKHDPGNPILSPSANGFDNNATEYPFPFWNPADRTYYAYYLGRNKNGLKQTGLLAREGDFGKWRRLRSQPVIAAEAKYERKGSSHPSVTVVDNTIHIIYTGESDQPPVICHASAPVSETRQTSLRTQLILFSKAPASPGTAAGSAKPKYSRARVISISFMADTMPKSGGSGTSEPATSANSSQIHTIPSLFHPQTPKPGTAMVFLRPRFSKQAISTICSTQEKKVKNGRPAWQKLKSLRTLTDIFL